MIGRVAERRGHWVQALVISLSLHGAAAATMMDVLPALPERPRDRSLPQIDILSLPVEQSTPAPVALEPVAPVETASAAPVAPAIAETPTPEPTSALDPPVVTPSEDMLQATVPPAERPVARPDDTGPTAAEPPVQSLTAAAQLGEAATAGTPAAPTGSPEQNAAIAELVGQLRARLAQPCLAALPQTIGGDEVMLTVLGAVDRDIADLFREVAGSVEVPMTERSVLLDARQCPAVDFVRAAAAYPALPLVLRLEASEVASDDRLVGQIEGVGGNQAALLLIDDNGVVQDLGRFTLQTGEVIRFDVPVRRVGGDRDTSQLLMVIAMPERPASIAERDGQLASDFFPPLTEAANGLIQIGVAPVYVRAPR